MSSVRVQLQQFEGPLDLLLYLIRKDEMDIFNINVTEITKQYLDYIKIMKEFDIEVAGEFIAMASTLIQIKSKLLLPQYNEQGEIVESEDPRKELVQKLLEYEKFKEAAKKLYDRPLLNRDQWARGVREKIEVTEDDIELEDNGLFSLIGSYRKMIRAMEKRIHKVSVKLQSIASRIMEMKDLLIPGQQTRMSDLLNQALTDLKEKSRHSLITFLSLLELGKMGLVSIYQTENYGEIYIQTKKTIEGDVVSRVEEYDNLNSEQIAQNMMAKSQVLTEEELKQIDAEDPQFKLKDGDGFAQTEQLSFDQTAPDLEVLTESSLFVSEEMASDDEILAAEMEIASEDISLDLNLIKNEQIPVIFPEQITHEVREISDVDLKSDDVTLNIEFVNEDARLHPDQESNDIASNTSSHISNDISNDISSNLSINIDLSSALEVQEPLNNTQNSESQQGEV